MLPPYLQRRLNSLVIHSFKSFYNDPLPSKSNVFFSLHKAYATQSAPSIESGRQQAAQSQSNVPPDWKSLLPAATVFNQAKKSKFIPFYREKAQKIVEDFWKLGVSDGTVVREDEGWAVCKKHKIKPIHLTMLARILLRLNPQTSTPQNSVMSLLGKHIMTTAAAMDDPTAIIFIVKGLPMQHPPASMRDYHKYMEKMDKLVANGVAEAMILLAQVATRNVEIEKALKYWQAAGEAGSGFAYSELGKIRLHLGNEEQAKVAFEKGIKLDDVESHFQLAQILMKEGLQNELIEELLLKAAASGSLNAASQLCDLYSRIGDPSKTWLIEEWRSVCGVNEGDS